MTQILIADDHAVVRAGYKGLLTSQSMICEAAETSIGDLFVALRGRGWDLLLLGMDMPDKSGLDVLRRVRTEHPQVPVLVTSGLSETRYARSVIRAGAGGFLSKVSAPVDMMEAVRTVLSGKRYVSPELTQIMVADLDQDVDKPLHARLSTREYQVFCKIATGFGVSEIARELSLSVKTISTYRTRIMEKLTFQSNADITAYALRNELIQS